MFYIYNWENKSSLPELKKQFAVLYNMHYRITENNPNMLAVYIL